MLKPVFIRNPTSQYHLTPIQAGQDIVVSLSKQIYEEPMIEISGPYLKHVKTVKEVDRTVFHISPDPITSKWDKNSSCFLGEIWIDSKLAIAKLCVTLECSNTSKIDHLSIINPEYMDVRLRPHNILELIVYDLDFTNADEWTWSWTSAMDTSLDLDQLGYDNIGINHWWHYRQADPVDHPYGKLLRVEPSKSVWTRQHHFWFRFSEYIVDLLDHDRGVLFAGELKLHGKSSPLHGGVHNKTYAIRQCRLFVDCNHKYLNGYYRSLSLKPKEEMPFVYSTTPSTPVYPRSKLPYKKPLPICREVSIIHKIVASLEDGCTVASPNPTPTNLRDDDLDDEWYFPESKLRINYNHNTRYV